MKQYSKKLLALVTIILVLFLVIKTYLIDKNIVLSQPTQATSVILPDFSGLAWVEDNYFLAVHDIKDRQDLTSPRINLVEIPHKGQKFSINTLAFKGDSEIFDIGSDLEGITPIPDTPLFLLAESSNNQKDPSPRLFLAQYQRGQFKIIALTLWPTPIENVEGIAVTKIGNRYVFLYAERRDGEKSTNIQWTTLTLNPLKFGQFQKVSFNNPFLSGGNIRPITDIAVDSQLRLYIASAYDPGNKGPFRSVVLQIGKISQDKNGNPTIILDTSPRLLATLDGLKVEGIAIRETRSGKIEIFVGTDDEKYGGVVRLLPEI